jgi:hypothetical protein
MHRQADPVGDPRWAEWGEPQHEDFGNPNVPTYWGGNKPAAYNFYSEGDSPSFLSLVNNGLRTYEGPPGWGGWGGRFARTGTTGQFTATTDVLPAGVGGTAAYYPMSRFVPAVQRDWATRLQWSVTENYEDANHWPVVSVQGGVDITGYPGETLTLRGIATDPDGDALTYRWWRYADADTLTGTGTVEVANTAKATFTIPSNAAVGNTVHLILEVDDRKTANPAQEDLYLTSYQRVVVTVAAVTDVEISLEVEDNVAVADYFIPNATTAAIPVNYILAIYVDGGKLTNVLSQTGSVRAGTGSAFRLTEPIAVGCTAKAFIWDENYVPLVALKSVQN